jgi:predicted transcriptional regulator
MSLCDEKIFVLSSPSSMSLCDEKIFVLSSPPCHFVMRKSLFCPDGGLDKTKIFSSQSDMVGWIKQRFSHHKVTWWAGQNKDFLITK